MIDYIPECLKNAAVDELVSVAEEVKIFSIHLISLCRWFLSSPKTYNDIKQGELAICAQGRLSTWDLITCCQLSNEGLLNCIRALGGYTDNTSADTIYATATFNEGEYLKSIPDSGGSTLIGLTL